MLVTYRYKMMKARRLKELRDIINCCGIAYNHCIALHNRYYSLFHKHLNKYQLQKHLTKLKKLKKYAYLKKIPSQSLQDITDRIERAYTLFFRNHEKHIKSSRPSFKKVRKYKSFSLKQAGYKLLDGNEVRIGNKEFKFYKSRDLIGEIKYVTIKRDSLNDIYLYFVCEVPDELFIVRDMPDIKELVRKIDSGAGKIAGFDFGLRVFLTGFDGTEITKIKSPLYLFHELDRVRRAHKKLSRKTKGSARYKRAKAELDREYRSIVNRRKEFFYETALSLVRKYDAIAIEDLSLKGMQKKWGRKVSDVAFGEFVNILEHLCQKYGCKLVKVDRYFPSSQTCSKCGYKNEDTKDLKVRKWTCPICGTEHDRDVNAAVNIRDEGLRLLRVGAST